MNMDLDKTIDELNKAYLATKQGNSSNKYIKPVEEEEYTPSCFSIPTSNEELPAYYRDLAKLLNQTSQSILENIHKQQESKSSITTSGRSSPPKTNKNDSGSGE
jgi:hypothetical protein